MRKVLGLIVFAMGPAAFFAVTSSSSAPLVQTAAASADDSEVPNLLAMTDDDVADPVTSLITSDSTASTVPGIVKQATDLAAPQSFASTPAIQTQEFTPVTSVSYTQLETPVSLTTLGTIPVSIVSETSTSSTQTTSGQSTSTAAPTTSASTTSQSTTTTASSSGGRTLVFAEEFNSFDTTKWKKEYSTYGDGNNELQCYKHDNVAVSNGKLRLTAKKETAQCPNSTRSYSSGMVRSQGLTFSPGQSIEYRVKLTPNDDNNQGGLWPAFWSSSWAGGGWPNGGEWDGFEVMTARSAYRSVYSIHYKNTSGRHGKKSKEIYKDDKFSDNWHVMRFDYGHNGVLTWYFDGVIVQTITDADTTQGWPTPFDQAMKSFKINLALGGSPGPIDDRALPATYEVDYVRIYDM